jgi:hypothetical protein
MRFDVDVLETFPEGIGDVRPPSPKPNSGKKFRVSTGLVAVAATACLWFSPGVAAAVDSTVGARPPRHGRESGEQETRSTAARPLRAKRWIEPHAAEVMSSFSSPAGPSTDDDRTPDGVHVVTWN